MRIWLRAFWNVITAPFRLLLWLFKALYRLFLGLVGGIKVFLADDPEDTPLVETIQKTVENPWGLLEHLNELRKHLFRSLIALALGTSLAFTFITQILDWLARPIGGIEELKAISVTEPVGVVMRVALIAGFSVSLPYIVFELLLFAAPGLARRSRLFGLFAIPLMLVLFLGGMLFAYYLMLPVALPVLLNFMGISTIPTPSSYIQFVSGLMFWIGISFELPLVAYVLSAMGILDASLLREQWRLAVVIIAIVAAAITPTVDPVNMAIVMLPLIVLYILSIFLAHIASIRRRAHQGA
jgi:sec-independent protein translocase protein TatC